MAQETEFKSVEQQNRTYFFMTDDGDFGTRYYEGVIAVQADGAKHVLRCENGSEVAVNGDWFAIRIMGGAWSFVGEGAKPEALTADGKKPRLTDVTAGYADPENQLNPVTFQISRVIGETQSDRGTIYLTCENGDRYIFANRGRTSYRAEPTVDNAEPPRIRISRGP